MKVTYICRVCGSKSVTLDAWAEWEEEAQQWTLGATFDQSFCHDCECEQQLEEVALADEQASLP